MASTIRAQESLGLGPSALDNVMEPRLLEGQRSRSTFAVVIAILYVFGSRNWSLPHSPSSGGLCPPPRLVPLHERAPVRVVRVVVVRSVYRRRMTTLEGRRNGNHAKR
ncbi:unnamed protein product [Arctogadus glacialis]